MLTSPVPAVRAVLLYADLPSVDDERQARFCLKFAKDHALDIVALAARSPAAALAVVRTGTAQAVLAAVEPSDGSLVDLVAAVEQLGGWVVYARPTRTASATVDAESTLIRAALANTNGDVELVAKILGVPLSRVRALNGTVTPERPRVLVDLSRHRGQRPRWAG